MRRLENLTFGEALEYAKKGFAIQRVGWNGKKMFVSMVEKRFCLTEQLSTDTVWSRYFSSIDKKVVIMTAFLAMKSADDKIVRGWLASQTDMLDEDWQVINPTTFEVMTEEGVTA